MNKHFLTVLLCAGCCAANEIPKVAKPGLEIPDDDTCRRIIPSIVEKIGARAAELEKTASHGLFSRSAAATARLAELEGSLGVASNQDARACYRYETELLANLENPSNTWTSVRARQTSLILGFISSDDKTEQFYWLWLPRDWDPTTAYPLVMYLHGKGGPEQLRFFTRPYLANEAFEARNPDGKEPVIALPWGRGNSWWKDKGRQDVYDCLADVRKTVTVDSNRLYLVGHSMGGYGVSSMICDDPAPFVAAGICGAGSEKRINATDSPRLKGIHVILWHGENDNPGGARANAEAFTAIGIPNELRIAPGIGHNMPGPEQKYVFEWVMKWTASRSTRELR